MSKSGPTVVATASTPFFDARCYIPSVGVKKPGAIPAWLADLVAGPIAVETMTFDVHIDNSALLETGFRFLYPSHREGVVATLAELGYGTVGVSDEKTA
jgi:hypothetical protein